MSLEYLELTMFATIVLGSSGEAAGAAVLGVGEGGGGNDAVLRCVPGVPRAAARRLVLPAAVLDRARLPEGLRRPRRHLRGRAHHRRAALPRGAGPVNL